MRGLRAPEPLWRASPARLVSQFWVLLGYTPNLRWLVDRDSSPWYPTATLFRQRQHDDWDEVLAQVAVELQKFVNRSGATTRFRIARTKCCLS